MKKSKLLQNRKNDTRDAFAKYEREVKKTLFIFIYLASSLHAFTLTLKKNHQTLIKHSLFILRF